MTPASPMFILSPSHDEDSGPALHTREIDRLGSVCALGFLEKETSALFDPIAERAAEEMEVPIALVTIVRGDDQILLGRWGLSNEALECLPRNETFCAHTILSSDGLVVPDARLDARFAGLGIVREAPHVRAYAGVPIRDEAGLPLGGVCAIDVRPREFDPDALERLQRLATFTEYVLGVRRLVVDLLGPGQTPYDRMRALDEMQRAIGPLLDYDCLSLRAPEPHRRS